MKTHDILFAFIVFCMLLVSIFSASATYTYIEGTLANLNFSNNVNDMTDNKNHFTLNGALYTYNSDGLKISNTGNGASTYLSKTNGTSWLTTSKYTIIAYYANFSDIVANQFLYFEGKNDETGGFFDAVGNTDNKFTRGLVGVVNVDADTTSNKWHTYISVRNNTDYLIYQDGVLVQTSRSKTMIETSDCINLGRYRCATGSAGLAGATIRNFCVINLTAIGDTLTDIVEDYNTSKSCVLSSGEEVSEISVTINWNNINTSANYDKNNISFTFNATVVNAYPLGNVTFYMNNILNLTMDNVNLSENTLIKINFSNIEQQYNVSINLTIGNGTANKTGIVWNVDRILPQISTSFIDYSNLSQFYSNNIYSNYTDTNLKIYSILVRDSLLDIVKNTTAQNLVNSFYANITSIIESDLGNFTIEFIAYDSFNNTNNFTRHYTVSIISTGGLTEEESSALLNVTATANSIYEVLNLIPFTLFVIIMLVVILFLIKYDSGFFPMIIYPIAEVIIYFLYHTDLTNLYKYSFFNTVIFAFLLLIIAPFIVLKVSNKDKEERNRNIKRKDFYKKQSMYERVY